MPEENYTPAVSLRLTLTPTVTTQRDSPVTDDQFRPQPLTQQEQLGIERNKQQQLESWTIM